MVSKVTVSELNSFFSEAFPGEGTRPEIIDVGEDFARVRLKFDSRFLRPGGVVSGPTQMSLADTCMYAAIFTRVGIVPMALTTSLNMSFLRPCKAEDVIATATLLKLGRKLAVGEVDIRGESMKSAASHAVVTYAMPDDASAKGN